MFLVLQSLLYLYYNWKIGPIFGGLLRISTLYTTRLIILLFSANFFFSYIFEKFIALLCFCLLLIIKLWKRKITATIAVEKKLKICTHTHNFRLCLCLLSFKIYRAKNCKRNWKYILLPIKEPFWLLSILYSVLN